MKAIIVTPVKRLKVLQRKFGDVERGSLVLFNTFKYFSHERLFELFHQLIHPRWHDQILVYQIFLLISPVLSVFVELLCHLSYLSIELVKIVADGPRKETIKVFDTSDMGLDLLPDNVDTILDVLTFF